MKKYKLFLFTALVVLLMSLFMLSSLAAVTPALNLSATATAYNKIELTVSAGQGYISSAQLYVDFDARLISFDYGELITGNGSDILDVRLKQNRVYINFASAETVSNGGFAKIYFTINEGVSGNIIFSLSQKSLFAADDRTGNFTYAATANCRGTSIQTPTVASINVMLTKSSFKVNEISQFTKDLISAKIKYSSGDSMSIPVDDIVISGNFNGSAAGNYLLTFTYKNVNQSMLVNVYDSRAASLSVVSLPEKTVYIVGEEIDYTGLSVRAVSENGSENILTADSLSFLGTDMSTPGEKKIAFQYNGQEAFFHITVKEAIPGDIDFDGAVTSADARLALRAAVMLESFDRTRFLIADVDKDNTISSADARKILRAAVGIEILN